jgi:hypothetical protein
MFGRVFYMQKNKERTVKPMIYTSSRNENIPFLRGGKFNRGHPECIKVLPTLKQRIQEMFNYAG